MGFGFDEQAKNIARIPSQSTCCLSPLPTLAVMPQC